MRRADADSTTLTVQYANPHPSRARPRPAATRERRPECGERESKKCERKPCVCTVDVYYSSISQLKRDTGGIICSYISTQSQRPQSQLELLSLSFPCVPLAHPASSSTNSKPFRRFRNKCVSNRPSERPSAPLGAAPAESAEGVNRFHRARMSSTQPDQLRWIALLS